MSSGNSSPFYPSTTRKEAATPPKPNPKIKQRRTNFASEIGTTICNSPSFTSKGRGKTLVTPPNPNRNPFSFVDGRLLHCRTNCNSDTATKTQFPLDLIEEILLRLGVKSLLRFKCVSKQWFSILSNQQFITRHLKIQTSIRTRQEFIVQNFEDMNFAIGTLDDNADGIRFRLLESNHLQVQPSDEILDFLGHCNGLVSARFYSEETNRSGIVVWNPSTMEQRRFPMPQCYPMDFQVFGFGYDSVSNDYKLVAATIRKVDKIQSLSLKRGLWKTVQCDVDYSFDFPGGVHFNGCICWLINRERRSFCGIVSFDLSTDRLREEESLSRILSDKSNMYADLELSGESLCLVESPDEVTYDVWMMEENVVTHTKSWIKLFRVSSTDGNFNTPLNQWNGDVMAPVCFTGNGKVLIFWHSRCEYALYDPDDQSINKVAELGNPIMESWPVSPYVESLVSLGG